MQRKNIVFILSVPVIIILVVACIDNKSKEINNEFNLNSSIDDTVVSKDLIKSCYGIDGYIDSSIVLETVMSCLNRSDYKRALFLLQHNYSVSIVKYSGYYGFQISKESNPSQIEQYIVFRLNEYLNNLPSNEQGISLMRSLQDSTNILYCSREIEYEYVRNNEEKDTALAKKIIKEIFELQKKFPSSKRLIFILAKEHLIYGNTELALILYDELIAKNYYSLVCLREIVNYLSAYKSPFITKYLELFKQKFPNECIIQEIIPVVNFKINPKDSDTVYELCKKCIASDFEKDSIYAKLLLSKFLFATKNFESLDSLINSYFKNYKEFIPDSTLLFERGIYSDLKMRSLFLRGRYNEICYFSKTDLGYNPIVVIENRQDLESYIQLLYYEYKPDGTQNFASFFKKNFGDCL